MYDNLYDSLDNIERVIQEKKKNIENKKFDFGRDVLDIQDSLENVLDVIDETEQKIYDSE